MCETRIICLSLSELRVFIFSKFEEIHKNYILSVKLTMYDNIDNLVQRWNKISDKVVLRKSDIRLPLKAYRIQDPIVTSICNNKNRTQVTSLAIHNCFWYFLSLTLSLWIFLRIEIWVYSISLPSLSLIGPLTTEIY